MTTSTTKTAATTDASMDNAALIGKLYDLFDSTFGRSTIAARSLRFVTTSIPPSTSTPAIPDKAKGPATSR